MLLRAERLEGELVPTPALAPNAGSRVYRRGSERVVGETEVRTVAAPQQLA